MAQTKQRIVFMFVNPDVDPVKHRATMALGSAELLIVGTRNYDHAVEVSKELAKEGVAAIELCAGFGNIGVARVTEAVKGVPIGVVRFDSHPVFQGQTGDQMVGIIP